MKPTSIIFLAFALVLIILGFGICKYGEIKAENEGVAIYKETVNDDGTSFYSYKIDDVSTASFKLITKDVDISVLPSTDGSRIELENFAFDEYSITSSGTAVTVDGTIGKLESFIDRSDGGLNFRGLRYLFAKKPSTDKPKAIRVYIDESSKLNSFTVNSTGGDINVSGIKNPVSYIINAKECNVIMSDVNTVSVAEIAIEKGDLISTHCSVYTFIANLTDGGAKIEGKGAFLQNTTSYDLTVKDGSLIYNGAGVDEGVLKVSQVIESTLIKINVTNGNITVNDGE